LVQRAENCRRGIRRRDSRDHAGHESQRRLRKTEDNQLIASSFSARKDEKRKVSFPKFVALAWAAANEKAKQIGWIT
jgi:hypothetical protein